MDDTKQRLEQLLAQLETERDELRMKLGLAKLEARDELAELEAKLDTLRGRLKVLGAEAKAAGGDVAAAADVLADEIKAGFTRLRNLM